MTQSLTRRDSYWGVSRDFPTRTSWTAKRVRAVRAPRVRELLSVRGLSADLLLVVGYVLLSRAFIGDEAKLGIKLGPVPLFVTDGVLLILVALSLHRRAGRVLQWTFGGAGAGEPGRALWVLFVISVLYCALAIDRYGIMAVHDLAMFGYCIFFPLVYFALSTRAMAVKVIRYFIYGACLGAIWFEFQTLSGIQLVDLYEIDLSVAGHGLVTRLSAGNLGADLGPALAGLFAYFVTEREHYWFHGAALLLGLITLLQLMDRTSLLGFTAAAGVMFILGVGKARPYSLVMFLGLVLLLLLSVETDLPIPGATRLQSVWQGLSSGANYENDPDAQFRLRRLRSTISVWMTNPVFGVGFGAPIQLDTWGTANGAKGAAMRGGLGAFNVGMPHNSFLVVLARTGVIGLSLICYAWFGGILRIVRRIRRRAADADQIASAVALIAMILTAALNLFFERPMLCAPFWILLAASYKLSHSTGRPVAARANPAFARNGQFSTNQPMVGPQARLGGAWQARWK